MNDFDTRRKPLSRLNADMFLSLLNSMVSFTKPVERVTFVLPLQIIHQNNYTGFGQTLFQVLNSYPVLKEIYVPFEKALLVINVSASKFFYYAHGKINDNQQTMKDIRTRICNAMMKERFRAIWTEEIQATGDGNQLTEGIALKNAKDFYDRYISDGVLAKYYCDHSTLLTKKKKKKNDNYNVFCELSELQVDDFETNDVLLYQILLLTEHLTICVNKDIGFFIGKQKQSSRSEDNIISLINMSYPHFLLLQGRYIKAIYDDEKVKAQLNKPSYDMVDPDHIYQIVTFRECCNKCTIACGKVPYQIPLPYKQLMTSGMSSKCKSDSLLLSFGLRCIYHYRSEENSNLIPIILEEENLQDCVTFASRPLMKKKNAPSIQLYEGFEWDTSKPLGFLIPNAKQNHIVFLKVWIGYNEKKRQYTFNSVVYDTLYEKDKQKSPYFFKTGDDNSGGNQYVSGDERKYFQRFIFSCLKPSLINSISQNDKCFKSIEIKKNIKKMQHENLKLTYSILHQQSYEDNTCGLCSVIAGLLCIDGKDPTNGVKHMMDKFDTFIDFHKYMSILFLNCAMRYIHEYGAKVGSICDSADDGNDVVNIMPTNNFLLCYEYLKVASDEATITKSDMDNKLGKDLGTHFAFLFNGKPAYISL